MAKGKPPWLSKTLWVNAVAIAALFIQWLFGWELSPEIQALVLSTVNIALRAWTAQPLAWGPQPAPQLEIPQNDDLRKMDQAIADRDGPGVSLLFDRLSDAVPKDPGAAAGPATRGGPRDPR